MEGTPFGRYRLVDLLGRGGMGEVWRAYDTDTRRVVAVKLLATALAADGKFVQRFQREAQTAASLNNPHVVPIHHYGEIDGRLYVDMRLIEGHDLYSELANGPLDPARAVAIVEQIAGALHAAHRVNLIHRDVKPSNILLAEDDFAYLIDFGIARAAADTRLTGTGATIGTWAYMAPERFNSGQIDARSDVYALACVLHECLTGERPYPGDSFEQLIAGHLFHPPPRPSLRTNRVPASFDDVIATGMAKNPESRYPTTKALATAARAAVTNPSVRVAPFAPRTDPVKWTPVADTRVAPPPQARPPAPPPLPPGGVSPTDPTRHRPTPTAEPPPTGGRRRRSVKAITVAVVAVIVAVVAATVVLLVRNSTSTGGPPTSALASSTPSRTPTTTSRTPPPEYGSPVVLPFTGLKNPDALAVDSVGNLYVTDWGNGRVVKLAVASGQQTDVPFLTGLGQPDGLALDSSGTIYVAEWANNRVIKLPPGATAPATIPISGLNYPGGIAVDIPGNLYITDTWNSRVVMVAPGSTQSTELPLTGLDRPTAVTTDAAGNVYVADTYNNRVVKLAADTKQQTVLPFTGIGDPRGITVDSAGSVYVSASGKVTKLAAGTTQQTVLPFASLSSPYGVAVDAAGNVYVAEWTATGRVLKLPKN